MGKKNKQAVVQENNAAEPHQQKELKKPIEKFLPHEKYVARQSKKLSKKKVEAIKFINVDKVQVEKAAAALLKFQDENQNLKELFTDVGFIYVEFDLSAVPQHYSVRPVQIELPVPIYSESYNSRVSIFSTNPATDMTAKLENLELPMISEVIDFQKVKKHYKDNKEKVKLLAANDLFFCDWKIYNLLRQPLGKLFYDKKKYPYPIDCEGVPQNLQSKFSTYQDYLNDLTNHTYFMAGNGPVYTIKIGRVDMAIEDLVKNVVRAIYRIIPHLLGDEVTLDKIRQISLKTFNSPSLPIYCYLAPEELEAYKSSRKPVKSGKKAKK